ncbi:uncharacterized protein PV09_07304 [Verruconis gallopava]|uniref:U6 snRNA-associated Sm-like protein LSm1 n=1 Tax=Verruconis gallopava TaxID=253628 RepID=A0A0D2A469_9PEZI|nr:uncharacterized protein PV09_07304 [Verruconis gallopava]KIW01265.1 hypothetical protein PV09_07304 [Verruconis gallopava]
MESHEEQVLPMDVPRLPAQMFTTAAQLLDLTDKKILCALRDGRKLFGVLRSWDQYGNIQLMDTIERYYCEIESRKLWGEIARGLYLIRGENVAYLGEIDLDLEDDPPEGWEKVAAEEIHRLDKSMRERQKRELKARNKRLKEKGLEREMGEEHIFV